MYQYKKKVLVVIPYIDFTVPDDLYTRNLCMNYFYDFYLKVLYYINISSLSENLLLFFPQGECFSMENSYQWKMYFKINNEAFQRKNIYSFFLSLPTTPSPNFPALVGKKSKEEVC